MEISGIIIKCLPPKSGVSKTSGKEWKSQEFVIETVEQYPKRVCFEVFGDKVDSLNIKEGENYVVQFDIDAHEYNGRWFNSIKAWRVQRPSAQQAAPIAQPYQPTYGQPPYTPQPYAAQPNAPYGQQPYPPTYGQQPAQPATQQPQAKQQSFGQQANNTSYDDLPF